MSGPVGRGAAMRIGVRGPGEPVDVWTWTNDPLPRAGDTRTWWGYLVDASGQHVGQAGVTVHWTLTATGGNATLSASSSVTDATGIATVDVTYDDSGTADDTVQVTGAIA